MQVNKKTISALLTLLFIAQMCAVDAAGLEKYRNRRGNSWGIWQGQVSKRQDMPTMEPNEHFDLGIEALKQEEWREARVQFTIVANSFFDSPYGLDARYYLGVANYFLEEYDAANLAFNDYLKGGSPNFFEQAIEYKFCIADRFSRGARRRPFNSKQLPKWIAAYDLAVDIYDEVIAAVPSHDIAVKALYSKARLHWMLQEYREAVDSFQILTRRFPKHELSPEAFVNITKIYLDQCRQEFQNPDLLSFAELNLRKFKEVFPRDDKIGAVEKDVLALKELYAEGFYETGQFYERKESPRASVIYYKNALFQFPETEIAELCRQRLEVLAPGILEQAPNPSTSSEGPRIGAGIDA